MGLIKQTTKLDHLGIIELQGNDSVEFLQGQMTQDIYSIEDSKATLTSILNPQGRIISTAFIFKWGESFILMVSNEVRDEANCLAESFYFEIRGTNNTNRKIVYLGLTKKMP